LGRSSVWSACSARRSQSDGSAGAGQRLTVWHQESQEPTAARLRFHVAGAASPQSASSALVISLSSRSASWRDGSSWAVSLSITVAYARRVFGFSRRGEERNASAAAWSVIGFLRIAVTFLALISLLAGCTG
jgi:hypothetical protein